MKFLIYEMSFYKMSYLKNVTTPFKCAALLFSCATFFSCALFLFTTAALLFTLYMPDIIVYIGGNCVHMPSIFVYKPNII